MSEKLEREQIYDTVIAPKLKEVAELCEQHGMNFAATCEYDREYFGTTVVMPDPSIAMRFIIWAIESKGNLDSFIIKVSRYVKEKAPVHNSMVLKILDNEFEVSRDGIE